MELRSRGGARPHRLRALPPAAVRARPAAGVARRPPLDLTPDDLLRLARARASARHERRLAAVGLVVLALLGAALAAVERDPGRGTRVSSGGPAPAAPAVPTTAPPEAAGSTTTTAPPGAATAPTPSAAPSTATTPPAATAASGPGAACRNSSDPACGPFRFDPRPGPDRPMTAEAATEPAWPKVGDEVVFRVTLVDPDGVDHNLWVVEFGDGAVAGALATATCDRFGPWDPPAPGATPAVAVRELRHVYGAPGTYTFRFRFDAGPFDCTDAVTGVGDRPYASSATGELTVVVGPN